MQDHRRFGIVDEKIEKAQRLRIGSKRGQGLGLAGFSAFVRRQEIYSQYPLGGIARHPSAVDGVGDRAKGLVDFLQYVEYRRGTVPDGNRHVLELGDVDVTG